MAIWSKKPAEKTAGVTPPEPPPRPTAGAVSQSEHPGAVTSASGNAAASPGPAPARDGKRLSQRAVDAAAIDIQLGAAFASIVRIMLRSPRHRQLPIAALAQRVLPAVRARQFFIAQHRHARSGVSSPLGFVTWASVSDELSRRLEVVDGQNDTALTVKDWHSGNNIWMLDAVGQVPIMNKMLETLAESEWKGQRVRARAQTDDGKVVIRTIQSVK